MGNGENFKILIENLIEKDNKYENALRTFLNYLIENELSDYCFDLSLRDIDKYFESLIKVKIDSPSTLNSHIAGLTSLFVYLMENYFNFRELHAYINTPQFKNKILEKIDTGSKKSVIPINLLTDVLCKIENYLKSDLTSQKNKKVYDVLIARLYIKLSLLIPLKASEIITLQLGDIDSDSFREISYNSITIKIPNSIRMDIIHTVSFAESCYKLKYDNSVSLFGFLYNATNQRPSTMTISETLRRTYKIIGASAMLETYKSGTKNISLYPPESYKKTAILEMLNRGANIVYLRQLTGLDINSLISDYEMESAISDVDVKSYNINSGIINSAYYSYL
ncbi:MAG: hypothetical protein E7248_16620 [Paenibacillaceae bacterium]|jgi:integrase|nr:hypothetical protein [Paenibacillaceae bacterium]